jgi:hypothetical protein
MTSPDPICGLTSAVRPIPEWSVDRQRSTLGRLHAGCASVDVGHRIARRHRRREGFYGIMSRIGRALG